MPFETPENPRQFFIWMFEEIFPGKSWKMENPEDYTITTNNLITWIAGINDRDAQLNGERFEKNKRFYDFESKFKIK